MKKGLLLVLMCVVFVSGSAQNAIGIKAGVNFASMSLDLEDEFGEGVSTAINPLLMASIISKIELSYAVDLILELGLVQRGYKVVADEDGFEAELITTFNQLHFSPGLGFNLSDQFSLGIGPYIGYATKFKDTLKFSEEGIEESEIYKEDFEDDNKFDYGANFNLNYLIDDALLITTGYSLGIMDYYEEESSYSVRNTGIMISIGYLFN